MEEARLRARLAGHDGEGGGGSMRTRAMGFRGRGGALGWAALILLGGQLILAGCDESSPLRPADLTGLAQIHRTPDSGDTVAIDPRQVIESVRPADWYQGKRAACSLVFDDTSWSHYSLAAPEMEARGFRGTFALVTSVVFDWSIWQELDERGHEIANHTRYHASMSTLTPARAEEEIVNGRDDILAHIPGPTRVDSFVYPNGDAPSWCWEIVARYHRCARGAHGINPPVPGNFMCLAGSGYYHPFSVEEMNANLDQAISQGGWYVPYYHRLTNQPEGSHLVCPVRIFRAHLDHIAERSGDVWVAPFGTVAAYIRERMALRCDLVDTFSGCCLHVWTGLDPAQFDLPLSVVLTFRVGMPEFILRFGNESFRVAEGTREITVEVQPGGYTPVRIEMAPADGLQASGLAACSQRLHSSIACPTEK